MKLFGIFLCNFLMSTVLQASDSVVNVFVWGGSLPKTVLQKFEKETGITVRLSTFDTNETLYAKLRASKTTLYDVIMPSAYYVERMRKQGLLAPLNKANLPSLNDLAPRFRDNAYDPNNTYSIPFLWGTTGIFYHQTKIEPKPTSFRDLWLPRFKHQLLLLDDAREIFTMALLYLGFNPNDTDPKHIKKAYEALLTLIPNIKLFANDSLQSILIDEDAMIGTAWNGDTFKAALENPAVRFVYPKEGFIIWIDCLAIPKNPPHPQAAHQFIAFLMKATTSKTIALATGQSTTNLKAKALLPASIRNNETAYPNDEILKNGFVQRDVDDKTLSSYYQYWERFKLAF